ncbi:MAG: hypothetical protein IJ157_11535 [Clostridia bacterium]|nr:hypothetical protein [Clostridia bacterium]
MAELVRAMADCKTLLPLCAQRHWIQDREVKEFGEFLPNYLYVYAEQPIGKQLHDRHMTGVERWMGEEADGYALRGDDYAFAMFLYDNQGVIDYQTGYEVDGIIRLLPCGREHAVTGEIVKVHRRYRRALICFRFGQLAVSLWTGYNLVPAPAEALPAVG